MFASTRAADRAGHAFAMQLGDMWAGASENDPPEELDAAIVFAPSERSFRRRVPRVGVHDPYPHRVETFLLSESNLALDALRSGSIRGSPVITIERQTVTEA